MAGPFRFLQSNAEMRALRVAAEVLGGLTLLISIVRWAASGSLVDAVSPLLPVAGWGALVTWFVIGVLGLAFARGTERLVGLVAVLPVAFVAAGLDASRLGLLVLAYLLVVATQAFVDLFRKAPQ